MKIDKFGVERWMDLYENRCKYNLAETCVESLTVRQLLELAGKADIQDEILSMKLTYGHINGSPRLRAAVAALYARQTADNVLICHGAIGANALVYETLVEPGDHVVAVLPTYQQHQSIPKSYGAKVDLLRLREDNAFLPDLDELKRLLTPRTRLLALNNPNNPTGSLMDEDYLRRIIDLCAPYGVYILCDEVYRGLDGPNEGAGTGFTASIADLYERGLSTGSMSKAYSLAGLRLGWIVSNLPEFIEAVVTHRDYNTISVGMLDDYFAALALEAADKVLERGHAITRGNRKILDDWVRDEPAISYLAPKSGTTALLKYDYPLNSWDFCVKLVEETGVMLTPGSTLDMEGYLRIGYANNPEILRQGLDVFSEFLKGLRADS